MLATEDTKLQNTLYQFIQTVFCCPYQGTTANQPVITTTTKSSRWNFFKSNSENAIPPSSNECSDTNNEICNSDLSKRNSLTEQDLKKFAALFQNDLTTCSRFLVARKYDIPKAVDMFRNYLKWRKNIQLDTMEPHRDFPKEMKNPIIKFGGKDKLGRLSIYLTPALHVPGSNDLDELEKTMAFVIETAISMLEPPENKFIILFDYADWGLKNVDSQLDKKMMSIAQNYFPELLGCCLLLYPPFYFRGVWAVLKPFVDPMTAAKIQMFGSDYRDKLIEIFDLDQLPTEYGGSYKSQSIEEFLDSNSHKLKSKSKIYLDCMTE